MEWLATFFRNIGRPFQWWVVLAPWEHGLRIRLGRVSKELGPGIYFRIPFLDRIYVQSVRLRTLTDTNSTTMTADGKAATFSIAVDLAIGSMRTLFDSLAAPECTVLTIALSFITADIGERQSSELTADGIGRTATAYLRDTCGDVGLTDIEVRITSLALVRTYRIVNNGYRESGGLHQGFDDLPGGKR